MMSFIEKPIKLFASVEPVSANQISTCIDVDKLDTELAGGLRTLLSNTERALLDGFPWGASVKASHDGKLIRISATAPTADIGAKGRFLRIIQQNLLINKVVSLPLDATQSQS